MYLYETLKHGRMIASYYVIHTQHRKGCPQVHTYQLFQKPFFSLATASVVSHSLPQPKPLFRYGFLSSVIVKHTYHHSKK